MFAMNTDGKQPAGTVHSHSKYFFVAVCAHAHATFKQQDSKSFLMTKNDT